MRLTFAVLALTDTIRLFQQRLADDGARKVLRHANNAGIVWAWRQRVAPRVKKIKSHHRGLCLWITDIIIY